MVHNMLDNKQQNFEIRVFTTHGITLIYVQLIYEKDV